MSILKQPMQGQDWSIFPSTLKHTAPYQIDHRNTRKWQPNIYYNGCSLSGVQIQYKNTEKLWKLRIKHNNNNNIPTEIPQVGSGKKFGLTHKH